jgi:small ligand-binding sensory domain FIST
MALAEPSTVHASVGASESFDTVEAAAEAANRARAGLQGSCDLAVVFASGHHLGMAKWVLSEVHERLDPRALIGCGAGGTVAAGRELEDTPGLVVWGASLPAAELETMHLTAERDAEGFRLLGLPESLASAADAGAAATESLIALCDPFSFPPEELLAMLDRSRPQMPVIGGLPAPRSAAPPCCSKTATCTPTARSPFAWRESRWFPVSPRAPARSGRR